MAERHRTSASSPVIKRPRRSLLAVQSAVCGVILLVVLLLRLVGGTGWQTCRRTIQEWMTDIGWVSSWGETADDTKPSSQPLSVRMSR